MEDQETISITGVSKEDREKIIAIAEKIKNKGKKITWKKALERFNVNQSHMNEHQVEMREFKKRVLEYYFKNVLELIDG